MFPSPILCPSPILLEDIHIYIYREGKRDHSRGCHPRSLSSVYGLLFVQMIMKRCFDNGPQFVRKERKGEGESIVFECLECHREDDRQNHSSNFISRPDLA